jgi:hypothetical protein
MEGRARDFGRTCVSINRFARPAFRHNLVPYFGSAANLSSDKFDTARGRRIFMDRSFSSQCSEVLLRRSRCGRCKGRTGRSNRLRGPRSECRLAAKTSMIT